MIRAEFDLSGLAVSLACDAPAILREFERAWAPFLCAMPPDRRLLDIAVTTSDHAVLRTGPIPKDVVCRVQGGALEVRSGDAEARAHRGGSCAITVAAGEPGAQYFAIANVLCAVTAWRLPDVGGLLLHAAGLVVDDRAFLLLGGEGAGKTTWAEGGKAEGASYLSDDVVAAHISDGNPFAMSFPFRGNHPTPIPPARWPLAAVLLPKRGSDPCLESVSALTAWTALEASVLYRDVLAERPEVMGLLDAVASVPARTLVFGPDGRSIETLRRL